MGRVKVEKGGGEGRGGGKEWERRIERMKVEGGKGKEGR